MGEKGLENGETRGYKVGKVEAKAWSGCRVKVVESCNGATALEVLSQN